MTNIWRLTKIQLLSTFGLNKALHTRDVKERRKMLLVSIGIICGVSMAAFISFVYSFGMAVIFEQIDRLDLLLATMMAVTSVVGFFTTIYKVSGVLFGFKDYDLVMSLPIKTSYVVASRVLQLYILNLFFTVMVMVPAGVVYAIKVTPGALYYVFFLITLVLLPFIPIIAATIIGALISWISSRFRGSRLISLILTLAVLLVIMIGSFFIKGDEQALTDMSTQLADMIFNLYPLAASYVNAVCFYQIDSLLLFIAFSVFLFMLFSVLLGIKFKAIHTGLNTSHASSKYKKQSLQASSPFIALYKKELRRYFGSSIYVLNTAIGMIMLLVLAVALLFVSSEQLGQIINIPQFAEYMGRLSPLIVSLFVALSCTTASSISLEGKNLWILKSSPISTKTILLSKIAVNLTVTVPIQLISCVLLMISLRPGWLESLLLLVIPMLYAFFSAVVGVIVNLKFPNFEWTNETAAVKQSAAVLVSMLIGFISLVVPFVLSLVLSDIDGAVILLGFGVVMIAICALLYRYMRMKGERVFQAL